MRGFFSVLTFLLCFVVLSFYAEQVHAHNLDNRRRHPVHALQLRGDDQLLKRSNGATFTYYTAGLGACGRQNSDTDFIVALNALQFDGGSHCFEMITITVNGKSTQAQIVDQCMGCPYNALDFSQGLFQYFAATDVGQLTGEWEYAGANPSSSTSSSQWQPSSTTSSTPTSTPTPWYSTTYSSSSSSSTPIPQSTTSSFWSATPSSSSSSTVPVPTGCIGQLNVALVRFGVMIVDGHNSLQT